MNTVDILTKLEQYGVGRRKLDDDLFVNDQPPSRLGIFDEDEDQCLPVTPTQCSVPGCQFTADSTLHYEKHYNSSHRYSCSQCRRVSPSPHLLDLHIQEQHDSFFAVMAARKPSYSCYIEECKDKFINAEERLNHCVKIHKLPKDFRFDHKPKRKSKNEKSHQSMVTDRKAEESRTEKKNKEQKFNFANNKQKGFIYNGKKFTKEQESSSSVDMDAIMTDLKENLPQS